MGILFFVTLMLSALPLMTHARTTRWCVQTTAEELKCKQLQSEIRKLVLEKSFPQDGLPDDFECIRTYDLFVCMRMIEKMEADLITLDSGLAYFAGRQHNMMPIMAENYGYGGLDVEKPQYHAIALTMANHVISFENLGSTDICFPDIGMSAGWTYPIGKLLNDSYISVTQCNAIVKAVTGFFGKMCLPGALSSFYNPFGNNPTSVCELCQGSNTEFCYTSDISAGFDGAFRCLTQSSGTRRLAFVRQNTIDLMIGSFYGNSTSSSRNSPYSPDDFRLFCPDGRMTTIDDYANCNWGLISSNVIMTSAVREPAAVEAFKKFLLRIEELFGPEGTLKNRFQLFKSLSSYPIDPYKQKLVRKNLMFSDTTKKFNEIGNYMYYTWVDPEHSFYLSQMTRCPSSTIRWCMTSMAEKLKCEDMIMAFKAKELKPDMDCLYGGNTTMCMQLINQGDADLINLDSGDIYRAGKQFNLIPIVAEDYGDMTMQYKVVAVARKTDKSTTLFNMKGKRACQPGIDRGDGWIIPLNVYIETEQFLPDDCTIFTNIGELFIRACIPGALDYEYNPGQKPINLCEACAAGGYMKCQRNSEEQYFGASGAFRCLAENGGDVAFVRHLTVQDNTDGRNQAIWARNRRSDDYELMCKDGRRLNIDKWPECHLGDVPSNAIVTSSTKSRMQKDIIWNLLNYGQQYFSSDTDGDFHMFDSGMMYTDLIFTDAAVRLTRIPDERQNYRAWLGQSFLAQIENLQKYTCVTVGGASSVVPSMLLYSLVCMFALVLRKL